MRLLSRSLGVLLVVGICTAITASGSLAAPAYFECAKLKGGAYLNSACSEAAPEGTGKFELQEGIGKGKPFKGKAPEITLRVLSNGSRVECTSASDTGVLSSPTTQAEVVFKLVGCTFSYDGTKCTSAGSFAGTVETNPLTGTLGYISAAKHEVGLDYSAESGEVFAEFACGVGGQFTFRVVGSLIGRETGNINVLSTKSQLTWNGMEAQEIKQFEGGPTDILEVEFLGQPLTPLPVEAKVATSGEKLEIKA